MNAFNLIIIGDEILHGSRQDKHFAFFKSLLESRGLKLNQVQYLPDEPDLLVKQLRRSFQTACRLSLPAVSALHLTTTPAKPQRLLWICLSSVILKLPSYRRA